MRRFRFLGSACLFLTVILFVFTSAAAQDWPYWRGPGMDLAVDGTGTFAPGRNYRLDVVWKKPLGSGYSGISILDGVAVTAFAAGDHDYVAAFDARSGAERWRASIGPRYPGHWGSQDGPISTPLLAHGRVFVLDTSGRLVALDLSSGKDLWSSSLPDDHASTVPFYGYATSPIPFEDTVIVQTGGKTGNTLTCFEAATGRIRWTAGQDAVNYQSPFLTTFQGKPLLVGLGDKMLFGIDPRSGRLLWTTEHGGDGRDIGSMSTNIVPTSGDRFFVKNRSSGSKLFELMGGGAREIWDSRFIKSTYVVPVHHAGHIYGFTGRVLTSLVEDNGKVAWKSRAPGDGFPILVDGHLVIVTKDGELSVGPASPDGYTEIAGVHLFDDLVWTPATFYDGSLYLRSMAEWARVDVIETDDQMTLEHSRQGVIADSEFGRWVARAETSGDPVAEVDRFLAAQPRFPVIEDGNKVHFVYRGPGQDLALGSDLFGGRTDRPMNHIPGTDFFYYSVALEPDARVTYSFLRDFETTIQDELNPQRVEVFYEQEMSVLTMPEWSQPEFLGEAPADRRGRLEDLPFTSRHQEMKLPLKVYLPAGYESDRRYPVLYVHTGVPEIRFGKMVHALDNLIGTSVDPLIAVFIPIPGEQSDGRFNFRTFYKSYAGEDKDSYRRMLVEEVVPLIEQRYLVIRSPESRGLTGGGEEAAFASYYAAAKHPELFGRIGLRSIVFEQGYRSQYSALLSGPETQSLTIYLEWGKYDSKSEKEGWDARADSIAFAEMLKSKGYEFTGGEVHDGTSWSSWRNRTDKLLETLFPLQ